MELFRIIVLCHCLLLPVPIRAAAVVTPASPAGLAVTVAAGQATFPDQTVVSYNAAALTVDGPDYVASDNVYYFNGTSAVRGINTSALCPGNHETWWDPWQPWAGTPVTLVPGTIATADNPYNTILGALYRAVDPESVKVTSEDGSKTFIRGTDYIFNPDWGQIGNISDRLGTPSVDKIKVFYSYVPQRVDLVQVDRNGTLSLKKGTAWPVCPLLPAPDAGHVGLAGLHVHTYDQYVITGDDIHIIDPAAPVPPVNPGAIGTTLAKLKSGAVTRIAFLGASTTDGAEAGNWWSDRSKTFRGRVLDGIPQLIPGAKPSEVSTAAHTGGTTSEVGLDLVNNTIIPHQNDLCIVSFGQNDMGGSMTGSAKTSPTQFRTNITNIVTALKSGGVEVILSTLYTNHPFYTNRIGRAAEYSQILRDIAAEQNVGLADVYTEWTDLTRRGIPPHSLLHNNNNHPGVEGHQVIAEVILRFFDPNLTVTDRTPAGPGRPEPYITSRPGTGGFTVHCGTEMAGLTAVLYQGDGTVRDRFEVTGGLVYRKDLENGVYFVHFKKAGPALKYVHVK